MITCIYTVIVNHRNNDLGQLRRKSSIWEEQILKLRLSVKADLNDIPLQPTLMHNASEDQIDLRSKFRNKEQRSRSVPNAFEAGKIHLFARHMTDDDDDDLQTDDDFSDDYLHTSTAGRNHQKGPTFIIDEDEELNDCAYGSPMSLNNEFRFPFVPDSSQSSPYNGSSYNASPFNGSSGSGKRNSATITMMSVSELSLHQ